MKVLMITLAIGIPITVNAQFTIHSARQGFSMAVQMNNQGIFGRGAFHSNSPPPCDFAGFAYPIDSTMEHLWGGGLWIGGLLDTSTSGNLPPIKLVSTTYEGWAGPYYEFFPGSTVADTIWQVSSGSPEPMGWDAYWGSALPFAPFSDSDFYCKYTDNRIPIAQHVPLNVEVIQSSYVWDDPFADGVQLVKYRIVNKGDRQIDSAYVGVFNEFAFGGGPCSPPYYFFQHYVDYFSNPHTGFMSNPSNPLATPAGIGLIATSTLAGSSRVTFRWYPGPQSPTPDANRYDLLSSGVIQPQSNPSEPRVLFGCGPFTIRPSSGPNPDTVEAVFAYVAAHNVPELMLHASRAREIYLNGGPTSVGGEFGNTSSSFLLEQIIQIPLTHRQ